MCPVVVDVGGGYGGAAIKRLKANNIEPTRFNGASASHKQSRDGANLSFHKLRAEAWWRFREALRPDQPGGSPISLPDDPLVRADLAAPRWSLETRGVLVESKDDIRKRLGRSPDVGDAIVMAWSTGQGAIRDQVIRAARPKNMHTPRQTHCNVGYSHMKRNRPGYGGRDGRNRPYLQRGRMGHRSQLFHAHEEIGPVTDTGVLGNGKSGRDPQGGGHLEEDLIGDVFRVVGVQSGLPRAS